MTRFGKRSRRLNVVGEKVANEARVKRSTLFSGAAWRGPMKCPFSFAARRCHFAAGLGWRGTRDALTPGTLLQYDLILDKLGSTLPETPEPLSNN
jgi:hypothetical protein